MVTDTAPTHTYAPYQEYWHDPSFMTVDSLDSVYTYFKIEKMEEAYNAII